MFGRLRERLASLSGDDQSALRAFAFGKTTDERGAGLNRMTVNQSKFLLSAIAPIFLLLVVRELTGLSGWVWWMLVGAAAIWFLLPVSVMLVGLFRAVRNGQD